jgi:hypothetical protein
MCACLIASTSPRLQAYGSPKRILVAPCRAGGLAHHMRLLGATAIDAIDTDATNVALAARPAALPNIIKVAKVRGIPCTPLNMSVTPSLLHYLLDQPGSQTMDLAVCFGLLSTSSPADRVSLVRPIHITRACGPIQPTCTCSDELLRMAIVCGEERDGRCGNWCGLLDWS